MSGRPSPYYVSYAASTPDERGPGWFFGYEDDDGDTIIRGPYDGRPEAEIAIDAWQFNRDAGRFQR